MTNSRNHSSHDSQPLHAVLWSLGKQLIQGTRQSPPVPSYAERPPADMAEKVRMAAAQQLVTSMRMLGISGDDDTMLRSLESMVLAGEIEFRDFIGRVQNLFPRTLDQVDVTLRMKIAVLTLPDDIENV